MKRASYREGVKWIAFNDDPSETSTYNIAGFISTLLLADIFGVEPMKVARDVWRVRLRSVWRADQ